MNKAILSGRLTKDPDVRYSTDGKAIARYTLAVKRTNDDASLYNIKIFCGLIHFLLVYLWGIQTSEY